MKKLFFAKELMTKDYQTHSLVVTVDEFRLATIELDKAPHLDTVTVFHHHYTDGEIYAKEFFAEVVSVLFKYEHEVGSFEEAVEELSYMEYFEEERLV